MKTLDVLISHHGVDVLDYLDRSMNVPVIAGLQRQGDVIIIPAFLADQPEVSEAFAIPQEGIAVVRGENGGNTHLLLADGDVTFAPVTSTNSVDLDVAVVKVAEGSTAYLAHPEHGYSGIAPGTYIFRRQREQASVIRRVTD